MSFLADTRGKWDSYILLLSELWHVDIPLHCVESFLIRQEHIFPDCSQTIFEFLLFQVFQLSRIQTVYSSHTVMWPYTATFNYTK